MMTGQRASLQTRFGPLTVVVDDDVLTGLEWGAADEAADGPVAGALMQCALGQLAAYDAGRLTQFDLPLRPRAGHALAAVLAAIQAIPFGQTRTYGEIARDTGLSAQSVGQCCGANPIPVIIPCHRVMGAKGLTGFSGAGGVETKVALLRHEGAGGFLI